MKCPYCGFKCDDRIEQYKKRNGKGIFEEKT